MALLASDAERRRLQHGARSLQPSINILYPQGRSAANPPVIVAAVNRWDGQTDGHPTVTLTFPDPYVIRGAPLTEL